MGASRKNITALTDPRTIIGSPCLDKHSVLLINGSRQFRRTKVLYSTTTLEVDIMELQFLDENEPGDSKDNVITIDMDAEYLQSGRQFWCGISVDWVAIMYSATPPVVFVPGQGVKYTTWETKLNTDGQLFSNDIDHRSADTFEANAASLDDHINSLQEQWGVEDVSLVCFSKGGVDAREYVRDPARAGKVSSIVQIGTPNAGFKLWDTLLRLPKGIQAGMIFAHLLFRQLPA